MKLSLKGPGLDFDGLEEAGDSVTRVGADRIKLNANLRPDVPANSRVEPDMTGLRQDQQTIRKVLACLERV